MTSNTILLITDDAALARLVVDPLRGHGLLVSCESNVDRAINHCRHGGYSLVLADAGTDGVALPQLVTDIRLRTRTPLIVISADHTLTDEVSLLDHGADDCIGRPRQCDSLIARVRALLRRSECGLGGPGPLDTGNIRLDPRARLIFADSHPVECTSIEYDILDCMARQAGHVVSREHLLFAVCGRRPTPLDRALDVHISRLRRKLRQAGRRIVTVRGVGYMLTTNDAAS